MENNVNGGGNPFEFFDFDVEEVKTAEEKIKAMSRPDRDKRICACGHPMNSHTVTSSGIVMCTPSRMVCPCKSVRPVLIDGDARKFLRKTLGPGPEHALARGILASIEDGKDVEWIIDMACDKCGVVGSISPVPTTREGLVQFEATGYDALLCKTCRSGS